ncbi:hypothetical protein T4C_11229 [Trichinella pseudospiralis]|nr:hypothetical protein T4D_14398 [Trichinella pseudospiralis]KRZ45232.1 hypothetical protein T4C_11229 [Trichinella pseudospiralis]
MSRSSAVSAVASQPPLLVLAHGDDRQQQQIRTLAAWIHVHVHASIRVNRSTASRYMPHRAVVNNVENRSHLTSTRSLWLHQHQDRITEMPKHND